MLQSSGRSCSKTWRLRSEAPAALSAAVAEPRARSSVHAQCMHCMLTNTTTSLQHVMTLPGHLIQSSQSLLSGRKTGMPGVSLRNPEPFK